MADPEARAPTEADAAAMVDVLADAFADDPVFTWLFPDPIERPGQCHAVFRMGVRDRFLPLGGSLVLPDAVAAWEPPRAEAHGGDGDDAGDDTGPGEGDAPDPDAFPAELYPAAERLALLGAVMEEHHPAEPHWYLAAVGVRPGAQGRGLGGRLLDHRTAELDAAGLPAYLEATTPRSRALYARHGFEDTGVVQVPGGPPMWAMWREPR